MFSLIDPNPWLSVWICLPQNSWIFFPLNLDPFLEYRKNKIEKKPSIKNINSEMLLVKNKLNYYEKKYSSKYKK